MKHITHFLLMYLILTNVFAGSDWLFSYYPADVNYVLYGGSLDEPSPPSEKETKIAFEVTGIAAKEIFHKIGPDQPDLCSGSPGDRFRSRDNGNLICIKYSVEKYSCYFGFDLKSGKSTVSSIC